LFDSIEMPSIEGLNQYLAEVEQLRKVHWIYPKELKLGEYKFQIPDSQAMAQHIESIKKMVDILFVQKNHSER